jgi:hypothetical protein
MTVCLGNVRTNLGNARPWLRGQGIAIYSHSPQPAECHETCGSTGALSHGEAGSGAAGRAAAQEPSQAGRRGSRPTLGEAVNSQVGPISFFPA